MTQIVKAAKPAISNRERQVSDPFAELNRFFESDPLSRTDCPDIIAWYGVRLRLLVAKSSDNPAYCFLFKVNREGVSYYSAHGSRLYGNTSVVLPCGVFILDVSLHR
jgi:hypothetical protein